MALTSFRSIVLAATAVSMTVSTTNALSSYLKKIPNGESFSQELGHPDNDSSQYTAFATAFQTADYTWATLCQDTFPGSTMTNGAAFGDPCCTWAVGGTPDFTVTAFTTTPTKATVCASSPTSTSGAPASTTAAPAATTASPAATTAAPAATTTAPVSTPAAPVTPASVVTTAAPVTPPPSSGTKPPPSSGCNAKGRGEHKNSYSYSFRH